MIEAMQASYGLTVVALPEGYYYDESGQYYVDSRGYVYRPVGGVYYPMGFKPGEEYAASSKFTNAPITVVSGQSISVDFLFEYKGPNRYVGLQVGNCNGPDIFGVYVRGGQTIQQIPLTNSNPDNWESYGSGADHNVSPIVFTYSPTVIGDALHMFILFTDAGEDYEIVYTDAFALQTAFFRNLAITSYAKE